MSLKQKSAYLKRRPLHTKAIILGLIFFLPLVFYLYFKSNPKQRESVDVPTEKVLAQTDSNKSDEEVNLLQEPMTILLLGLDSRKGDSKPRCDAVHLFTFSPPEEKIIITSVPRGTHVDLGEEVATPSAYLANVCEHRGIGAAIKEIIRITDLQPDHIIKVNFSQTLGILRFIGMPTTPTLQFLRDRRSYLRGDYQRSHNQALFLKDMILDHTQQVADLPKLMKQIIFKMVDTGDLDFETASSILNWVVKTDLWQKPEKIELVIKPKPWYKIIDIHFSASDYSTNSWQDDEEFQDYQSSLETYLQNLIEQGEKYLSANQKSSTYQLLKTPFYQQLWLQLEDEELRNQLHFDLLRLYVFSTKDEDEAKALVEDFMAEMEMLQNEELKDQAEELMNDLP